MYVLLPLKETLSYEKEAEKEKVSEVARGPKGFLTMYKKYGYNLPPEWITKRENFIKRHLVQYRKNPTYRRKLALIMWAYLP